MAVLRYFHTALVIRGTYWPNTPIKLNNQPHFIESILLYASVMNSSWKDQLGVSYVKDVNTLSTGKNN